jgi:hypothetical protein
MDHRHRVMERETPEVGVKRENHVATLAEVFQCFWSLILYREVVRGTEESPVGHCREFYGGRD